VSRPENAGCGCGGAQPRAAEPAVDCSLGPEALARRRADLERDFAPRIRTARELPDGIALGFATDRETARAVADFVAFEQECCSFARYAVERRGGELVLEIRGPSGTAELMRRWLPPGVPIEPAASPSPALRIGASGAAASALALLLCATPVLPLALGAVGLGHLLGAVGGWVDAIAAPAFAGCAALLGWSWLRRRRASAADSGCGPGC